MIDKSKKYTMLFIGNSYTQVNCLPNLVETIAKSAGYDAECHMAAKGGWVLLDSADPADRNGAKVDEEFKNYKFDYVVLQEQSVRPAKDPAKFFDAIRILTSVAKENGATPLLYDTWGRKAGNKMLETNHWTDDTMPFLIASAYEAIGKELGVDVAWAGLAFYDVYKNHPEIDLYSADLHHPSFAGSYLAAMTIFATITGDDPTTVEYIGELSENDASILKDAAKKAAFNSPEIPKEYKTSSEGVTTAGFLQYALDKLKK